MRRQHKRVLLKGSNTRIEIMTETKAQVSDLSMCGVGVKTSKRLKPGSPCVISIGSDGSPMILPGTAVWERFAGWSVNPIGFVDPLFSAGILLKDQSQDLLRSESGEGCDTGRAVRVMAKDLTVQLSFAESLSILNISYGGVLAISWNPIESDAERSARLYLPDNPEPIKCLGRVTSCVPVRHETERTYHIGFEFVAMDEISAKRLAAFIRMRSAI